MHDLLASYPMLHAPRPRGSPQPGGRLGSAPMTAWDLVECPSSYRNRPDSTCRRFAALPVAAFSPRTVMTPEPAFTVSFSVFPALNVGDVDADIETASPVLGLRPVRAGRLLVPKVPNPGSRTSSPSASASPMMANTPSTASLAAPLFTPVGGSQTVGHLRLVHVLTSRRDAVPFRHPRTAHRPSSGHRLPRIPACRNARLHQGAAIPSSPISPTSAHRSGACISNPSRRARCVPPCS